MTDEEYKQEYDKAAAELDAAASATTARDAGGRFAKAPAPEETPAPTPAPNPEPAPVVQEVKEEPKEQPDPLGEIKAELERTKKIARDNQAAFTRLAQENARIRREQEQREREANRPALLDANPGLADAIRHVVTEPVEQQPDPRAAWTAAVDEAHPGIFQLPNEDDLVQAVAARAQKDPDLWASPLGASRIITEEKLAAAERQLGKRFAAETARQTEKSAMSVPGAGAGSVAKAPVDAQLAEVTRIRNMSDKDFAAEVRRAKGF
jgi:hypothetical protein